MKFMEHGPSREDGSCSENHREFMLKHDFKMRCENKLPYSLVLCMFKFIYSIIISRLLLLFSRARRMRNGSDKGLR